MAPPHPDTAEKWPGSCRSRRHGYEVELGDVVGTRSIRPYTGASPAQRPWRSPARWASTALELQSNNAADGQLNTAAHGVTPWGTYLACEENWNGYFARPTPPGRRRTWKALYGVRRGRLRLQLAPGDPRFDLARHRRSSIVRWSSRSILSTPTSTR